VANNPDGSYSTRDLWQEHPTDPLKWKYVGRLDDTITLSNGEKATPIGLENSVRDSPYVEQVVCVGAQQPTLGLLVIPSERATGMSRAEIIPRIWPSVEAGNARVPAYAQISAEMINFLPIGTPYPSTDKGTVIRPAFYRTFQAQIEAMYAKYEEQNASEGLSLSEEELRAYVRNAITKALKLEAATALTDDTDFFSFGLDSLGSMQVQSSIRRELNTGKEVGQNVVFEKPTVRKLAGHLYHLRTGEVDKNNEQSQIEVMKGLVEKYSHFEQHVPGNSKKQGDYIVSSPPHYEMRCRKTNHFQDCNWRNRLARRTRGIPTHHKAHHAKGLLPCPSQGSIQRPRAYDPISKAPAGTERPIGDPSLQDRRSSHRLQRPAPRPYRRCLRRAPRQHQHGHSLRLASELQHGRQLLRERTHQGFAQPHDAMPEVPSRKSCLVQFLLEYFIRGEYPWRPDHPRDAAGI